MVPAEDLEREARTLAEKNSGGQPLVVADGKQAFYPTIRDGHEQAYTYTKEVMSFNVAFADAQEGMCAFLKKRKPEWKGR